MYKQRLSSTPALVQSSIPEKGARAAGCQRGVSLLEVLIALVILSIGLLGMAALQASSLRNNQSASERSLAVMVNHSIIDAMRANLGPARAGDYNIAFPGPAACWAAPGNATQADADRSAWLGVLVEHLGQDACGSINCDGASGICTVESRWNDSRATAGNDQMILQTQVRL